MAVDTSHQLNQTTKMKLIDYYQDQFKEYFQQFVTPSLQGQGAGGGVMRLKAYYCDLTETVIAASRSEQEFGYPLLHLELPQVRFEEKSELLMVICDTTGVVLVNPTEDTPTAKNAALKTSRQIWDSIFSTLKRESVYKDMLLEFSLNGVKGEVVLPTFADRTIGYEFRFSVTFFGSGHVEEDED